jgi:PTS system nitrogen regulatory IIA component
MNRLAKLLPPGNIALDVSVTSKKRVFEQAGLLFENNHGVARAVVTDNLFARESLGSTGLGAGVAIPHGRIKGLKQPLAAFMRLAEPVPFESPDGKPVSLLIVLLVPEQATQQHLEILSEIAQLLSHPIPTLLITGDTEDTSLQRLSDSHVQVLYKPVKPNVLIGTIHSLIGQTTV